MPTSHRHCWVSLIQGIVICATPLTICAQQPQGPRMPAPPPMRFVSRDERSGLSMTKDAKARLKMTLDLATLHLGKIEEYTTLRNYDQASEELGRYLGLLEDAQRFLFTLNSEKGSTRDLYRHVEIALRPLMPRLAVLRRLTPVDYAGHLKTAEEYTRDLRSNLLDTFYGHSILRERPNELKKPDEIKDPTEGPKRP